LSQLHVFIKVVENQSVTKASEQLHMTQPAVSIQLKNFQEQFEIPLFEIISRRIHITPFGHEIAASAKEILFQADLLKHKALKYQGELTGTLRLSIVSTGKYVIPFFIQPFIAKHPGVDLQMDVTNKELVIESLNRNEVDFALVSILPDRLLVDSIPILDNSLYLFSSPKVDTSLNMTPKDLVNYPLILREKGSGTRQSMERFLKQHGIAVRRKLELTSNEAVKQAVKAGLGMSIMPLIGLKHELEAGELTLVPIDGLPVRTQWQLISLKGKRHGPVAEAFKNFILEKKVELANQYFNWLY
ncbi:MAG: LysR family transcriptional regulator, partial [Flavobacteriia bacterium]|nr:LysR family transcriptional regulator [Flavobacteriia bacterium]